MPFLQSVSRVCKICVLLFVPYLLQTSSKVATNCPFSSALSWNNPKRAKYSLVSLGVCGCSLSAFKNAFKIVVTSMCLYLLFVVIRFKRLFPHWQGLAKPCVKVAQIANLPKIRGFCRCILYPLRLPNTETPPKMAFSFDLSDFCRIGG